MWGELAVLGAAFVGAAGAGIVAYYASRESRRQFARGVRQEAYLEVLGVATEIIGWSEQTHPLISREGDDTEPDLMPVAERVRAQILVDLHGTEAVRKAFEDFTVRFGEFVDLANVISKERYERRELGGTDDYTRDEARKARRRIRDCRSELSDLRDRLAEAMRSDVHGE